MKKGLSGIFVVSYLLVMLVLLTVIVGCFSIIRHQAGMQADVGAKAVLNDTAAGLTDMVQAAIDGGNIIADHQDVYSFASGSPTERLELRDNVRSLLSTYVRFESGAVNAYLFTADGAHISAAPQSMEHDGAAAYMISRRVWVDEQLDRPFRQAYFSRNYVYGGRVYYVVCTPIYPDVAAPMTTDYKGVILLILQADALEMAIPDRAQVEVLIADGNLLLTASDQALRESWNTSRQERFFSQKVPQTRWTVYSAVRQADSDRMVQRVGVLCVVIGASMLLLLGVLMAIQYRSIVGPIVDIAKQMDALDTEAGGIINPSRGRYELNRLTNSLNGLLGRIHQLNNEMMDVKLKAYEEHNTFLQAQINPHFLYNNFEVIRGMAGTGNAAAIREMASCMAAIYRYCCKGESLVALQQELECLERYTRILSLRYGEQYQIAVSVQQEALMCFVPRMILQPLVENAVSHGFVKESRRQGRVEVSAEVREGTLLLTISDDGIGMTAEQLEQYNQPAALHDDGTHSHIGITNVMRRLQLLYGERVRTAFSTAPSGGLCIAIYIDSISEKTESIAEMRKRHQ